MRAKNALQEHGLTYVDVGLDQFPHVREEVKQKTGKQTVPQIFFNHIHVGGASDLLTSMEIADEWERLLNEIKNNPPGPDAPTLPDPSTAVASSGGAFDFTCEPDQYALLVDELKKSGIIKDHKKCFKTHKKSFTGKDFVKWVMEKKNIDKKDAIEMGQTLIDKNFGNKAKDEAEFKEDGKFYRLLEDDESSALNAGATSSCTPRPANNLGEDIRKLILKLYAAFLSPDGKKVNYSGIAKSSEFDLYKKLVGELVRVDVSQLTREEKLAFFINIYNALVIHGNIVKGPPSNLWQRYKFFNTVRYIIAGQTYSLQDVENGVLRANRKGVGMITNPFPKGDPRLSVALNTVEPLIHFALVCGAKSCPPIKTYSADDVMNQLTVACESFLDGDDALKINVQKQTVALSQIFNWYKEDFGGNNQKTVEWILSHMGVGEKKDKLQLIVNSGQMKVSFMAYDWGVNAK